MKYLFIFLIACLFMTVASAQSTQTFINKLWEHSTGIPDTIDWSATTHDNQNNIIICGNTTDGSVTNLLLSKYNSSGDSIWEVTWSHPFGLSDYGTAVRTDAQNNIYVTATSITSAINGFDYVIQKYSPAGTLYGQSTITDQAILTMYHQISVLMVHSCM